MKKNSKTKKTSKPARASLLEAVQQSMTYKLTEADKAVLLGAGELTEEEGSKITVLFESAVNAKIREVAPKISAVYRKAFKRQLAEQRRELVSKISDYLKEVIEEWFKENKVAIKRTFRDRRNAQIVEAMQKAYTSNFIQLPERNADVLKAVIHKASNLKKRLVTESVARKKAQLKLAGLRCESIFDDLCEGLADTQVEKFLKLVGHLEIDNPKEFRVRATEIREAVFPSQKGGSSKKVLKESKTAPAAPTKGEGGAEDPISRAARMLGGKQV